MAVSSGKLLIAGMLGLGLAASVLTIFFRHEQTHRALALWGPKQAVSIATAPVVTALRFDPPLAQFSTLKPSEVIGQARGQRPNVSDAYGIGSMRQLLVEDTSFDWQSDPVAEPPGWSYGMKFSDPTGPEVLVLLDPATGWVREAKSRQGAKLRAGAAEQLKAFLEKQFAGSKEAPEAE